MHTRRAVKNIIEFIRTYMSELFSQLYSAILSIAFHQINSGWLPFCIYLLIFIFWVELSFLFCQAIVCQWGSIRPSLVFSFLAKNFQCGPETSCPAVNSRCDPKPVFSEANSRDGRGRVCCETNWRSRRMLSSAAASCRCRRELVSGKTRWNAQHEAKVYMYTSQNIVSCSIINQSINHQSINLIYCRPMYTYGWTAAFWQCSTY